MSETAALLSSRLVLVTGKGGTGKTTFAAALATLAAARGQRVLLCEVDAQRPSLPHVFGVTPTFRPTTVRDGLQIANLTFAEALRGFLVDLVPSRRVVDLVLDNVAVQRFLDFTPGSRELVTLSAVGAHVETHDLVIVDMPASGHTFSMLDITRSALGLFRSGPVRRRAAALRRLLLAPTTRVAFVALPEEMVVNETLESHARLREYELMGQRGSVFLNRATLPSLSEAERTLIARLSTAALEPAAAEFARAGRWEDALEQRTRASAERLAAISAPVLVAPVRAGAGPAQVVEEVAVALGREVGVTRRDLSATGGAPGGRAAIPGAPEPRPPADGWLDRYALVVCVGAGGVGKTTTAAAIALQGARSGRRSMVLTIDPAKRLANSLGLEALGNAEQRVPLPSEWRGELWAMMLDSRHTFDELVARIAPDEAAKKRIVRNHVYRHMADTFAGSQDYMATEKLYDLVSSGRFDLVVLDTPPVKNALDFLESPGRLVNFLDERILKWFLDAAPRSRFSLGTSAVVHKLLGYVFGADFLTDLEDFFRDFEGLYAGFRERHAAVVDILGAPSTGFVTVCGPTETTLDIAAFFQEELSRRRLPRTGIVVNQVHRCDGDRHDAAAVLGRAARELGADLPEAVVTGVLARLGMAHRRMRDLAVAEHAATGPLRGQVSEGTFYREVARFEDDVHDLPALARIGGALMGEPAGTGETD